MSLRAFLVLLVCVLLICLGMAMATHAKAATRANSAQVQSLQKTQGSQCRGQEGVASWYGPESGHRTATGERFDGSSLTMAVPRRSMMGKTYRVTDLATGRSVVLRANDLGPAARLHRVGDVSRAAALRLGMIGRGVIRVCLTRE